ncbi:NRAMP family divalent metal transporter [Flavihumibacter fluvii]|uniref:NRAMP family divalent metal transporter n=1 Tax=Flavihumibacter fluvii TaxID=2838157 RepID=UPI001BDF6E2E|nr:NRAMP family divalent metal transporter [Flavihumibacter fluvii]ULQ51654.1 divalent metal cation transporter [Flavihumibacter fluvii]
MKTPANYRRNFWSAAFLMATSAIGPGFLTQTTLFTQQLLAGFGFVIAVSILIDIVVQLNIWRIIVGINKPAQEIANALFPGLGAFLSLIIIFGGFAFNIGNIAGAGLGLEVITGMNIRICAITSAAIGIGLLLAKDASKAMDNFVKVLGILMIGLTAYVAFAAKPPLKEVIYRTVWPVKPDWKAVITIVGGTVGGYICFAGAHRLLDTKSTAPYELKQVSAAAVKGILTASSMRILLFLATLGVVTKGLVPDPSNPAAGVFRLAAGEMGFRFFGIVMWSAAITSVIGSAFTSVSFISTYHPFLEKNKRGLMMAFILLSTIIFLWVGKPVDLLVWAGLINGLILPLSLLILLAAVQFKRISKSYQHPKWLTISGVLVALCLAIIAGQVMIR